MHKREVFVVQLIIDVVVSKAVVPFPCQALPGQQTPDGVPSFKLVLVGDGGTGTPRTLDHDRFVASSLS